MIVFTKRIILSLIKNKTKQKQNKTNKQTKNTWGTCI